MHVHKSGGGFMVIYDDLYKDSEKRKRKNYILEKMTESYAKEIFEKIVEEFKKMNESLINNGHVTEVDSNTNSCTLKTKSPSNKGFDRILKYEVYPPYERYKNQHKYVIDEVITTELNGGLILRNNVWDLTKEYGTYYLVSENKKEVLTTEEMTKKSYQSLLEYIT